MILRIAMYLTILYYPRKLFNKYLTFPLFQQDVSNWRINEYVRVESIFDKDYIGSVKVNDSKLRYFEPAAGRNYLIGVNATYRF